MGFDVKGKVVLITGGAGGIGRALAMRFGKAGASLALIDINQNQLLETAAELEALGYRAMALTCDITDLEQCQTSVDRVIEAWGGVDVLINNAGISHRSLFAETGPEVIRKVMEVNFHGAVHCTHAAIQSLIQRRGAIVAISSVAGFAPLVGRTGYAASKHALHGFFDTLRTEVVGHGISVLIVCPSFTDTAIEKSALAGDGSPVSKQRATVGSLTSPDRVADNIFRAVVRRKKLLVLSSIGKTSHLLSRFLPGVYERVMRASQGSEFEI